MAIFGKEYKSKLSGQRYGIFRECGKTLPSGFSTTKFGTPFAEDSCGNIFTHTEHGCISFWDHETDTLTLIASSWDEFSSGCIQPEEVTLRPGQVKSAWVNPEFAKKMGQKAPNDGVLVARWPRALFYIVLVVVLAADQLSKAWVQANLTMWHPLAVIPGFFNLTFTHNTGVAFGMFQGKGLLVTLLVVALALAALLYTRTLNWAAREPNVVGGLIVGGALGNLIDRARLGYVVDFLDFQFGTYHWFIFNIADSCICVAVTWLVIAQLRSAKPRG